MDSARSGLSGRTTSRIAASGGTPDALIAGMNAEITVTRMPTDVRQHDRA